MKLLEEVQLSCFEASDSLGLGFDHEKALNVLHEITEKKEKSR